MSHNSPQDISDETKPKLSSDDNFTEFIFDNSNDDNQVDFNIDNVNFSETSASRKNIRKFLKKNIGPLIKCPITQCVFFKPMVVDDGFIYECYPFNQMLKSSYVKKSPMTREEISTDPIEIPLISEIIKLGERYKLKVCNDKYISGDVFEDNADMIIEFIKDKNYDFVYKFTKFDLQRMNANGILFGSGIFQPDYCSEEYFKSIKYVIDHADNLYFTNESTGLNMFHVICFKCFDDGLFDYIYKLLSSKNIEYFNVNDKKNMYPLDYACKKNPMAVKKLLGYGFKFDIDENVTNENIINENVTNENIINENVAEVTVNNSQSTVGIQVVVGAQSIVGAFTVVGSQGPQGSLGFVGAQGVRGICDGPRGMQSADDDIIIDTNMAHSTNMTHSTNNTTDVDLPIISLLNNNLFDDQLIMNVIDNIGSVGINRKNLNTNNEMYPIIEAIVKNKYKIIKYMLNYNVDLNVNINGWLPIHYALRHADEHVCQLIISNTINFECETPDGWRPIHFACKYGNNKIIEMIMAKDVSLNVPIKKYKDENQSYLPINLIEINSNLQKEYATDLIDIILQLMEFQNV